MPHLLLYVAYWSLRLLLNPSFSLIPYHTCIISHNINISYQIISNHIKSSSHNISSSQKTTPTPTVHIFQQIPIGETYPSTFFFQIGGGGLRNTPPRQKTDPSRWVKKNHLGVSHPPFSSRWVKSPPNFSRWVTLPPFLKENPPFHLFSSLAQKISQGL